MEDTQDRNGVGGVIVEDDIWKDDLYADIRTKLRS